MGRPGTPGWKRWQVQLRRHQAFVLRFDQGKTWRAIAAELGYCSKGAAHQDVMRYLDAFNARQRVAEARAREAREVYGPVIREAWQRLVVDMRRVDPVELVLEAERPGQVVSAIGALRRHIDEYLAVEDADPLDDV